MPGQKSETWLDIETLRQSEGPVVNRGSEDYKESTNLKQEHYNLSETDIEKFGAVNNLRRDAVDLYKKLISQRDMGLSLDHKHPFIGKFVDSYHSFVDEFPKLKEYSCLDFQFYGKDENGKISPKNTVTLDTPEEGEGERDIYIRIQSQARGFEGSEFELLFDKEGFIQKIMFEPNAVDPSCSVEIEFNK